MSLGRAVRTRLGRFEAPISDFYRARFIDLDACARLLAKTVRAPSILEVGCGDGQMATCLLERFPNSTYVGIDVAPEVGRLFRGEDARATFRSLASRSFIEESPQPLTSWSWSTCSTTCRSTHEATCSRTCDGLRFPKATTP